MKGSLAFKEEVTLAQIGSNIFTFIQFQEQQHKRSTFFSICLLSFQFIQLIGILTSMSANSFSESSLQIFFFILRSFRVTPIFALLDTPYIGFVCLVALLLIDIFFIAFIIKISICNTQEESNNFKMLSNQIQFVQLYMELFKPILFVVKMDFIFGGLLCMDVTKITHSGNPFEFQNFLNEEADVLRCSYQPQWNSNIKTITIIICVLNILTACFSVVVTNMIYNTAGFFTNRLLKTRFSYSKFIYYLLVALQLLFSYPQMVSKEEIGLFFSLFVSGYFYWEYTVFFPLVDTTITSQYASMMHSFTFACLLLITRRLSSSDFHEINIFILFIVFSTFARALQHSVMQLVINKVFTLNLAKEAIQNPKLAILQFEYLIRLTEQMVSDKSKGLLALGIIKMHQEKCEDAECPCHVKQKSNKLSVSQITSKQKQGGDFLTCSLHNTNKESIQDRRKKKIKQAKPVDVYITELAKNHQEFYMWILQFVEYQFKQLIQHLGKQQRSTFLYQDLLMRFWFFEIRIRQNNIKALFTLKSISYQIQSKNLFFASIELACSRIIENMLKTKDKSMRYSYRQKDAQQALQFEQYEHIVLSENIKKQLKQNIVDCINKKIELLRSMIRGVENINILYIKSLEIVKLSERLEDRVKQELLYCQDSMHYMRLLSIIRIRMMNDPLTCIEIEKKIKEINEKDRFLDENTINSLNFLKGNVVSVVSGFRTEIGSILRYSESAPHFFGYKKAEFDQLQSINDICPDCIAVAHDNFIMRLVETGKSVIIRKYRIAISKNKQGFIFPIHIYVNYFWNIHDDFCFSALMLKIQSKSQFILLSEIGEIEEFTENFFNFIKEVFPELEKHLIYKLHIDAFIPQLIYQIQSYETSPNHSNLKYELFLPHKLNKYLKAYKIQQNLINNIMTDDKKDNSQVRERASTVQTAASKFLQNASGFYYDITCNILQEKFQFVNGSYLELYLLEITQICLQQMSQSTIRKNTYHQTVLNNQSEFIPSIDNNKKDVQNSPFSSPKNNEQNVSNFFNYNNNQDETDEIVKQNDPDQNQSREKSFTIQGRSQEKKNSQKTSLKDQQQGKNSDLNVNNKMKKDQSQQKESTSSEKYQQYIVQVSLNKELNPEDPQSELVQQEQETYFFFSNEPKPDQLNNSNNNDMLIQKSDKQQLILNTDEGQDQINNNNQQIIKQQQNQSNNCSQNLQMIVEENNSSIKPMSYMSQPIESKAEYQNVNPNQQISSYNSSSVDQDLNYISQRQVPPVPLFKQNNTNYDSQSDIEDYSLRDQYVTIKQSYNYSLKQPPVLPDKVYQNDENSNQVYLNQLYNDNNQSQQQQQQQHNSSNENLQNKNQFHQDESLKNAEDKQSQDQQQNRKQSATFKKQQSSSISNPFLDQQIQNDKNSSSNNNTPDYQKINNQQSKQTPTVNDFKEQSDINNIIQNAEEPIDPDEKDFQEKLKSIKSLSKKTNSNHGNIVQKSSSSSNNSNQLNQNGENQDENQKNKNKQSSIYNQSSQSKAQEEEENSLNQYQSISIPDAEDQRSEQSMEENGAQMGKQAQLQLIRKNNISHANKGNNANNKKSKSKKMILQSNIGSTSSVNIRALNNIVKRIYLRASDRATPGFLMALQITFFTQWVCFITISLLISVIIINNLEFFIKTSHNMSFSAQSLLSIGNSAISSQYLGLKNDYFLMPINQANPSNISQQEFQSYQNFMEWIINNAYINYEHLIRINKFYLNINLKNLIYKKILEKSITLFVEHEFQDFYTEKSIDVFLKLQDNATDIDKNNSIIMIEKKTFILFEFFKHNLMVLKTLNLADRQKILDIYAPEIFSLQHNLKAMIIALQEIDELFRIEIQDILSFIKTINLQIFLIGIFLLIICFILFIPSFRTYKEKVERILMIISRITENEAVQAIVQCKATVKLIESNNEKYLRTNFSDMMINGKDGDLKEEVNYNSAKQTGNKQKSKKGSIYLYDRIKVNKMNYTFLLGIFVIVLCSSLIIVVVLLSFYSLIYLTNIKIYIQKGFIIIKDFSTKLWIPMDQYSVFIQALSKYMALISTHNTILINQVVNNFSDSTINNFSQMQQNTNITYQFYKDLGINLTEIISLRDDSLQQVSQFFSKQYLELSLDSQQTHNFKVYLQDINSGQICKVNSEGNNNIDQNNQFNSFMQTACQTLMEGLITRGLKNAITNSINLIKTRNIDSWSQQQIRNFLSTKMYTEELQVNLILAIIMNNVLHNFEADNDILIQACENQIVSLYLSCCIIMSIVYLAISIYSYKNILSNYYYIKKAIHLIPFERLTEDSTTRFLLKKFIDF